MRQSQTVSFLRNGFIAFLHTVLLIPVFFYFMELNRVPHEQALLSFFIVTQLLAVFLNKKWVFLPFQFIHILYRIYTLFPPSNGLTIREWMSDTWDMLIGQFTALLDASLTDVPNLLILTLLFILITFLTLLTVHDKWALPSFLVPFSYLMIVHTFTDNRVLSEMVLLIGVGFLLIAVTKMSTDMHWGDFLKNIVFTTLVTFGLVSFSSWGIDRFRTSQEWVEVQFYPYQRTLDDNGFFNWINTYSTGLGYQRTGFGLDDTVLGGPLHQDFTPLFRAYTDVPNYWKVLHRTEYTGSGWENYNDDYYNTVAEPINSDILNAEFSENFERAREEEFFTELTLQWREEVDYIAYPYGWSTFELDTDDTDYAFHYHDDSGYYTLPSYLENISHYSVFYDETFPDRFDEERLSQDDGWRDAANEEHQQWLEEAQEDDEELQFEYEHLIAYLFDNELQLPESLPQRVSQLAEEITAGLENEYEMVRAIESYLKEDGGYRYSLLEVERTPEGEDYVDYFLFDSLIGYCDNFSSAMTILLRTLGIPARWTKGFTPGNYVNSENSGSYYQVSNANAHSWVEVYFPSFGWVPFEPSPSFANPVTNPEPVTSFSQESYVVEEDDFIDLDEIDDVLDPVVEEEEVPEEVEERQELKGTPELNPESSEVEDSDSTSTINWSTLILTSILLGTITLFIFLLFRWKTFIWMLKQLISKSKLSLDSAIHLVLFLFKWKKQRMPGQTIEIYMNQWKPFLTKDTKAIEQFVILANSSFYSPMKSKQEMNEEQQRIIITMIDVYKKAPNLNKGKHDSNPLR